MSVIVVVLFTLPLVIGLAVTGVKVLEFALNREIASSKAIARNVTIFVVATGVAAVMAWFLFIVIAMSGDRS